MRGGDASPGESKRGVGTDEWHEGILMALINGVKKPLGEGAQMKFVPEGGSTGGVGSYNRKPSSEVTSKGQKIVVQIGGRKNNPRDRRGPQEVSRFQGGHKRGGAAFFERGGKRDRPKRDSGKGGGTRRENMHKATGTKMTARAREKKKEMICKKEARQVTEE